MEHWEKQPILTRLFSKSSSFLTKKQHFLLIFEVTLSQKVSQI
jgi:hypothetical protein